MRIQVLFLLAFKQKHTEEQRCACLMMFVSLGAARSSSTLYRAAQTISVVLKVDSLESWSLSLESSLLQCAGAGTSPVLPQLALTQQPLTGLAFRRVLLWTLLCLSLGRGRDQFGGCLNLQCLSFYYTKSQMHSVGLLDVLQELAYYFTNCIIWIYMWAKNVPQLLNN